MSRYVAHQRGRLPNRCSCFDHCQTLERRGNIFLKIIVSAPASLLWPIERRGYYGDRKKRSNRHPVAVEFVVLIVAAVAGAEIGEVVDELDCRDPLYHLETQLVLAA